MKTLRVILPFLCIAGGFSLILFSSFFAHPTTSDVSQDIVFQNQNPSYVLGTQKETIIPIVLFVQDRQYKIAVPPGSTVYEAMDIARQTSDLRFRGKDFGGLGFFVEEINGVSQDSLMQMYWVYSINDKKSQTGVSSYQLSAGDIISWTYEKSY